MPIKQLSTEYLIAGAGAVGMAFADTLLTDTNADIIIVDQHHSPGGHWNLAYPFVTLHQPSNFYGVNSRELSNGKLDEVGLNKGLGSLASGDEVNAYFKAVMHERFLPSGRVRYFPMSEWQGAGLFKSILTGQECNVAVEKRVVDATYLKTTVPSTHVPNFKVDEDCWFLPLNELPNLSKQVEDIVIVGGGKTGMDACLWLLQNGVDPNSIRWIIPRDSWMLDRHNTQAGIEFFNDTIGAQAAQFEAIANSTSIDDLFDRLEAYGILVRLDPMVKPKMFHGATVSKAELNELRRIKNIIRLGRVQEIGISKIVLEKGDLQASSRTLCVDCSASAISNLETKPIFEDGKITPQTVRSYQPVFSAALVAHVEATRQNDQEKNQLCGVVPLPNHDTDWITMMIPFMMNQYQWSRDPEMRQWLADSRLDGFSSMVRSVDKQDTEKQAILTRLRENSMPAMAKLQVYQAQLEGRS